MSLISALYTDFVEIVHSIVQTIEIKGLRTYFDVLSGTFFYLATLSWHKLKLILYRQNENFYLTQSLSFCRPLLDLFDFLRKAFSVYSELSIIVLV